MKNHENRSATSCDGKALAETIINAIAGRAGVRINGEIVRWKSIKSKSQLCVANSSIPVNQLHENLTVHELHEIENLPFWTGNNEYQISSTVLCHVENAIKRFEHKNRKIDMNAPVGDSGWEGEQEKVINQCYCQACSSKRHEAESNTMTIFEGLCE
jgi:hypothetical protein